MITPYRLLLICGSLRTHSSNAAVLNTLKELAPAHVEMTIYTGLNRLPHFNPDDDEAGTVLHPVVTSLRQYIRDADALLFSTPEYAGGLPGSFKNLLDWAVGGGETYGKPVAWINASSIASPTGGADAHESLRKVLGYTGAEIVEAACTRIPIPRQAVGADGIIRDLELRHELETVITALVTHLEH